MEDVKGFPVTEIRAKSIILPTEITVQTMEKAYTKKGDIDGETITIVTTRPKNRNPQCETAILSWQSWEVMNIDRSSDSAKDQEDGNQQYSQGKRYHEGGCDVEWWRII